MLTVSDKKIMAQVYKVKIKVPIITVYIFGYPFSPVILRIDKQLELGNHKKSLQNLQLLLKNLPIGLLIREIYVSIPLRILK